MSRSAEDLLDRYFAVLSEEGVYPSRRNAVRYLDDMFGTLSFGGKSVLEIGGGSGWLSLYARCRGAARVVCLEPEGEGSRPGAPALFRRLSGRLGLEGVRYEPSRVQDFHGGEETFDILLMHNSINHLDEEACVGLRYDDNARQRYRAIFRAVGRRAAAGAILIATDASRLNFFRFLGLTNPFCPTLEWEKHQTPQLWADLLAEAGFARPRIRWSSFNRLGRPGRVLLGHALASYFLTSHFCLTMDKIGPPIQAS